MRRILAGVAGSGLALAIPAAALAADGTTVEVAQIATWLSTGDYTQGLVLALFGAAGAIFVAFSLVGGVIPGTSGRAQLDKDRDRLDKLTEEMQVALLNNKPNAGELRQAVNELRDDFNRERNRQFAVGAILYVVLGAFVAAALAQDLLQAVTFGATWTGLVGSLGLKSDFEDRKAEKDDSIDELTTALAALTNRPAPATRKRRRSARTTAASASAASPPAVDDAFENAAAARAL